MAATNSTLPTTGISFVPVPPESPHAQPPLFSFIADAHLPYLLPVLVYWVIGLTFHAFDVLGLFAAHKLHTPTQMLQRNRATLAQVLRAALTQQAINVATGYALVAGPDLVHSHDYSIALWAQQIRARRIHLATLLPASRLDAFGFVKLAMLGFGSGPLAKGSNQTMVLACHVQFTRPFHFFFPYVRHASPE
jgi:sphinganine C4-monooxygenase